MKIIDILDSTRVVEIKLTEAKYNLIFTEMCDQNFSISFTKKEVKQFIEEIQFLYIQMKENTN